MTLIHGEKRDDAAATPSRPVAAPIELASLWTGTRQDLRDPLIQKAYFDAWILSSTLPCLIVQNDLQLIWRNAAADALLSGSSVLTLAEGILTCVDRSRQASFRAFMERPRTSSQVWAMPYPEDGYLIMRADPLAPSDAPPATGLTLFSTFEPRYLWADLRELFGFTSSEATIAMRMVSGAGAQDIAAALDISVETVRTHVRRIYAKLGVANREQFFSLVSPFRLG